MSAAKKLLASGPVSDPVYVDDLFGIMGRPANTGGVGYSYTTAVPNAEMVITKKRDGNSHFVVSDTYRSMSSSPTQWMLEDTANPQTFGWQLKHYTDRSGFLSLSGVDNHVNHDSYSFVDYFFGKGEGFFTTVQYTGTGAGEQQISHDLGTRPGMIIIKNFAGTGTAKVYHCETGDFGGWANSFQMTDGAMSANYFAVHSKQTSQYFTVKNSTNADTGRGTNDLGASYTAYIFARGESGDAVFGSGKDELIIKCGSFTPDGNGRATVNLGFKPQFFLHRAEPSGYHFEMWDQMRGFGFYDNNPMTLRPSQFASEFQTSAYNEIRREADGIRIKTGVGWKHYYLAIAEPHKPAADQTEGDVFSIEQGNNVSGRPWKFFNSYNNKGNPYGWPVDFALVKNNAGGSEWYALNREGHHANIGSFTQTALALPTGSNYSTFNGGIRGALDGSEGVYGDRTWTWNTYIGYLWKKAPGFFDMQTYIGTGSAQNIAHNLGVAPEMVWVKSTNGSTYDWVVYHKGISNAANGALVLNSNGGRISSGGFWNSTHPSSTHVSIGSASSVSAAPTRFLMLMFATVPGISKVGSYTGTGTGGSTTIDCGFDDSSPRFLMIRNANAAGDWYVYDNAINGITISANPYLRFNSNQGPTTDGDWIEPTSTGFRVNSGSTSVNASGTDYIFYIVS